MQDFEYTFTFSIDEKVTLLQSLSSRVETAQHFIDEGSTSVDYWRHEIALANALYERVQALTADLK